MDFDEPASASGNIFSCGTQRVIPSEQDSAMLPARVANQRKNLIHLARSWG